MEDEEDTISLYRKFVSTGFIRTFLGRITSLIYIIIISRLVLPEVYDIVVILAAVHISLSQMSLFGLRYSSIHFARNKETDLSSSSAAYPTQNSILLGAPIIILCWEFLLEVLFSFNLAGRLIFLQGSFISRLTFDISLCLSILVHGVKASLNADLKSDAAAIIDTINSVSQSFLVPTIVYIVNDIYGFFIAWGLSTIISLVVYYRQILSFFKTQMKFGLIKDMLLFGFPIFAMRFISIIGVYAARFVIFFQFTPGNTSLYHWVLRFNELTLTSLTVLTSGLFPLLLKHANEREPALVFEDNKSYIKLASTVAQLSFGSLVIGARFILSIVLPAIFLEGLTLFYIVSLGVLIQAHSAFLQPHLQAFAGRKLYVFFSLSSSFISIIAPILLAPFGLLYVGGSIILISLSKFTYMVIIGRELRFSSRSNILFPLLSSFISFIIAILFSLISSNAFINIFTIPIYIIVTYVFLRFIGIIQDREISLIVKFVPERFQHIVQWILF